ncbi:MAG: hypothetical protein II627_09780, partial [Lachnospiraceae bacterium]|nr:hypothetical protein [Lachnospiraceae bacterium]
VQEDMKQKLIGFQTAYLNTLIASLPDPADQKNALLILEGIDNIAQRNAVNSMAEKYAGYSCILNGNPEKGYFFIVSSSQADCRALAGQMRQTFRAKGGGSKEMIQGQISVDTEQFRKWFMSL